MLFDTGTFFPKRTDDRFFITKIFLIKKSIMFLCVDPSEFLRVIDISLFWNDDIAIDR